MSNDQWKWWVGHDGERYHTACETREEAAYIASEEQEGGWIVEAKQASSIELSGYFDADNFLEQAEERAYDDHGDPEGGSALFEVEAKHKSSLQAQIRKTIDEWQAASRLTFKGWMFTASRHEEFIPAAGEVDARPSNPTETAPL